MRWVELPGRVHDQGVEFDRIRVDRDDAVESVGSLFTYSGAFRVLPAKGEQADRFCQSEVTKRRVLAVHVGVSLTEQYGKPLTRGTEAREGGQGPSE